MTRLYEQLRVEGKLPAGTVLVDITNVTKFVAESDKRYWDYRVDFPNLAPPWPLAFYEWVEPRYYTGPEGVLVHNAVAGIRVGCLADSSRRDGTGWMTGWTLYVEDRGRPLFVPAGLAVSIEEDGRLSADEDAVLAGASPELADTEKAISTLESAILNPFMAISLTHCRNVTAQKVTPPPKLAAKQLREKGIPKVSYLTLTIEPMRKVLRSEGGMDQHGSLPKALHICRGHFKDYRERGLFGKQHGIYWWETALRGSSEAGAVLKDYEIDPTGEENEDG